MLFSKYTLTISIWCMIRFKNKPMVRYICSDFLLIVTVNVLAKSMPDIYEKSCITSCALNLATDLSG